MGNRATPPPQAVDATAAGFGESLLGLLPAVWRFMVTEGVELTNNHAEGLLRAVLWRKNAFGCHNEGGRRFVEQVLTVVQTLHLQGRPVLRFLHDALVAHCHGLPAPSLLPTS